MLINPNTNTPAAATTTTTTTTSSSNTRKSTSSSGFKHIAKNEISAPTNFRHVVCGYDDYAQSRLMASAIPVNSSTTNTSSMMATNSNSNGLPHIQPSAVNQGAPPASAPTPFNVKSSSLSSSSSSSSSILHSPNSPGSNHNHNHHNHQHQHHHPQMLVAGVDLQSVPTPSNSNLRPDSVLYNSKLLFFAFNSSLNYQNSGENCSFIKFDLFFLNRFSNKIIFRAHLETKFKMRVRNK